VGRYPHPFHHPKNETINPQRGGNAQDPHGETPPKRREGGHPRSLLLLLKEVKMITRRYGTLSVIVAHTTTEDISGIIDNMEYVFDGIIEIELDPNLAQLGIPVRRLRVKRLKGLPHAIDWFYFTISRGSIVPINIDDIKKALGAALNIKGVM
jgi:hypothetical protein